MLRAILYAVILIVVAAILFLLSGYVMPRNHQARAMTLVPASQDVVWELVSNTQELPTWFKGASSVKSLPAEDGHEVWKQIDPSGKALVFITLRREEQGLFVREVRDPGGAFGGTWTIRLEREGNATKVTIVEDGWIAVAPFRPVQRFIFGFDTTMKEYLSALSEAAQARARAHDA